MIMKVYKMIEAVVFDLDDTLYDEEQFVFGGFMAAAGYLADNFGLDKQVSYKRLKQLLREKGRGKIFNDLLAENGLNCALISELIKIYRNHQPDIQLYPDAQEMLQYLQGKVKLGLITDGAANVQWNKIRALGLDKVIDLVVVTDDFGPECCKPNLFPYRLLMERFGLTGQHLVYIGDNPFKDFAPARELGWLTIRVYREKGMLHGVKLDKTREADFEVASLDEINDLRGVNIGRDQNR